MNATMVAAGDVSAWVGLAFACHNLNDNAGKLAALDKALALDPRNLRALLLKADHHADAGDTRAAAVLYRSVVAAAPPISKLPPFMQGELRRAQSMSDRYNERYEKYLRNSLAAHELAEGRSSNRFSQSLDILFGKKKAYFQEPLAYFFPELPQIQFYDCAQFPWLGGVEAATDDIRGELQEVMQDQTKFTPYVEGRSERFLKNDGGMFNNPEWSAFFLWKNGEMVTENAARCPKTLAAFDGVPLTRIGGRAPSILFSLLRPGARIPPHTGFLNARLICHLPLIVPPNCNFRVGNDVRSWSEGKAWVFDDSIEHEAANGSDQIRVILIFDVWRPELTEDERRLVAAMMEAIDAYGDRPPEWDN